MATFAEFTEKQKQLQKYEAEAERKRKKKKKAEEIFQPNKTRAFADFTKEALGQDDDDLAPVVKTKTKKTNIAPLDSLGQASLYHMKSEKEAETWRKEASYQYDYKTTDYDTLNQEIYNLESRLSTLQDQKSAKVASRARTGRRGKAGVKTTEEKKLDEKISALNTLIASRKALSGQIERYQEGITLTDTAKNAKDFKEKSAYVKTGTDQRVRYGDSELLYEYINNPSRFPVSDTVRIGRRNKGIKSGREKALQKYRAEPYEYMTEEEIEIFNYYYATQGEKQAKKYLETLGDTLEERQSEEQFSNLEGKTAKEILYGFEVGTDQFARGIDYLLNPRDDYEPIPAIQRTGEKVRKDLADDGKKILGSSLGQIGYDAVTTTSNMAPSILASSFVGMVNPTAGQITGATLMGASAAGNARQEMINNGYDVKQANTYAALIGTSESALSYALGGISKLGGKATGKALSSVLSKVDNGFARFAINYGGKMASEGLEEGLQEVLDPIFENIAVGYEKNTLEDTDWEQVTYSALLGAVTAGVLDGGESISATKNHLSKNERAVVDKVYESAIEKEAEKKGRELTTSEKNKLYDKVVKDVKAGDVDIGTVAETLGSKNYAAYKEHANKVSSLRQEVSSLQTELNDLKKLTGAQRTGFQDDRLAELNQKLPELKAQLESLEDDTSFTEQFDKEITELTKGSKLAESRNEWVRSHQYFEVDVSKYEGKAKEFMQKVVDSKLANNSNKTHRTMDLISKVAFDKDMDFDVADDNKIMELVKEAEGDEFDASKYEGKTINGFELDNGIAINLQSRKLLESLVGHEVVHALEKSNSFKDLEAAVIDFAKTTKEYQSRYDEAWDTYRKIYKNDDDYENKIKREVVADLIGDYLFTDTDFINNLSTKNRSTFMNLFEEIKYFCKVATAGSEEARKLEKVKKLFEKAYRENVKGKPETQTESDTNAESVEMDGDAETKYSLVSDDATIDFLENQPYVVTYKAMQVIDGKLYPPMAAEEKVQEEYTNKKGEKKTRTVKKLKQPSELGKWQQSDERPDLAKQNYDEKKGYSSFTLLKGNGKELKGVAYNPYEHTSNIVLNDQFSSAHRRDNLVTVEYHIPVSELTSGYKAQYAESAVGKRDWHTGLVASKLKNSHRDVYLTRWSKPVRILSDAEVAQKYKEILDKEDGVTVPWNVVTQSLREELEKVGVPIDYSDKKIGTATFNFDASLRGEYLEKPKNSKKKTVKYSLSPEEDERFIDFKLEDFTIDELMKFTPEQFEKAYESLGIEDFLDNYDFTELTDDEVEELYGGNDITLDDISDELNVEPKKLEILFRRKGLGTSHIEDNRTAVMKQERINREIYDSGAGHIPDYARKYITRISTKDFIDLTVTQNHIDRDQFDAKVRGDFDGTMADFDYEAALTNSKQSPYLEIDRATGQILGHNGRHRIRALEKAGIESVEIVVELYEDGSLVKYNSETISDMAISSQFDTAIETHLYNVIPLNETYREEIESNYGEKAHTNAGIKYSLSAEQQEYFKDSVVRDENGDLKVMYHGTSQGGHTVFDTYGSNYGLFGQGSYFTDNKDVAESYTKKGKGNNPQVYESYLNIKNPIDMDAQANPDEWRKQFPDALFRDSGTNEEFYRDMEEWLRDEMYPKWEAAEIAIDGLQGMGYDGVTHIGGGRFNKNDNTRHQVYIAFEPEQIKNIDNLKPTNNADIRYSISDSDGDTLSKEQQEYFKDSKVVDADTNGLIVLYHGSRNPLFTEFNTEKGVWLTPDRKYAGVYADVWHSWRDDMGTPLQERNLTGLEKEVYADEDERLYKVYANITNPLDLGEIDEVIDDEFVDRIINELQKGASDQSSENLYYIEEDIKGAMQDWYGYEAFNFTRSEDFINYVKEQGFDGFSAFESGRLTFCAFDAANQVKLTTNKNPTTNPDIRYSISEDSEGNKLTVQQETYFKDSKAVDNNGNLLKVYHTTKNDFTVFDKSKKGEATEDANTYLGFFFSDDAEYMQNFPEFKDGKTEAYYLNMTNPIDMTNISKDAFLDIVEVLGGDVDEASIVFDDEGGGQLGNLLDELTGDFYYQDFIKELKPHYNELMSKGYDGVIGYLDEDYGAKEYIVLDSNQAKLTSNTNPTADADTRYSISTEKEAMPKTRYTVDPTKANLQKDVKSVRAVRTETMLKNGYTQDDVDEVNRFMDNLADFMEKAGVTYKFIGLKDVNNAKLKVTYDKNGNPKKVIMSAMVKNGEYPINFDFTRICKKRESMSMVIKELAKRKTADGRRTIDTIDLNAQALWTINEELREAGLETACLGCFVESKRYNIQAFADKAVNMWNSIVDEVRQENGITGGADSFNFAEGIDLDKVDYGTVEKIFADYNTVKGRTSPEARMRALIRNGGELYQKYLQPSDLMTPEGIESIKAMSTKKNDFYGILKGVYGQAAPKEVAGFSPYNSEVALLPQKKGNKKLSEYVASIGGVRMQSFSDFLIANVYDYMQMVADLSARHLPAHAYTKEIAFAKIFGMTGIKINMSVMFDIDPNLPSEYAGLQFVADENGDEVYNGVKGRWDYLVGDQKRRDDVYKATGKKPYVQSIGFDEAVALQNDPRYSKNCGIIGVGMSDRHVLMMLDDGRIRYVIPYHSSSLPAVIAETTHIKMATDYTDCQNTRKIVSITDVEGNAVDIKALREQCNSWGEVYSLIQENKTRAGWEVQTESDKKLAGRGEFDIYKDVEITKNPKQTAENYLQYCAENNYMPVFEQFAFHENYYKLLFDFDPYDTVTGEYSPQTEVKNIYSGYNPAEGLTSTATVEQIINDEMSKQNEVNKARNKAMPSVVNNVLAQLGVEHNEVGVGTDDMSMSISDINEQPIRRNNSAYIEDAYFNAPIREDFAKNATTTDTVAEENVTTESTVSVPTVEDDTTVEATNEVTNDETSSESNLPNFAESQIAHYKEAIAEERANAKDRKKASIVSVKRLISQKPAKRNDGRPNSTTQGAKVLDGKQYMSYNGRFVLELNTPDESMTVNDQLDVNSIKGIFEKVDKDIIKGNYNIDAIDISLIRKEVPKGTSRKNLVVVGDSYFDIDYVDAVLRAIENPEISLSNFISKDKALVIRGSNGQSIIAPVHIDSESNLDSTSFVYRAEKVGAGEITDAPIKSAPIENAPIVETVPTVAETSPIEDVPIKATASESIKPAPEKLTGEEAEWAKNKMARADKGDTEQTASILTEEPETAETKKRGLWSYFKESVLDKGMVFESLSKKHKNRELEAKWNFIRYADGNAQTLIGKGANGVKSLKDIQAEVEETGLTKEFYEYLYHKHNISRMTLEDRYEGIKNKPVFSYSVTADASQDIVNQYEFAEPRFKEYANDVYTYMNHLRNMMVENGVISQETADLWAEMYPHYVPIRRVGDTGLNVNVPLDTGRTSVNAPVKAATGGSRDILPLFDTMAQRTMQTYKAVAKNSFGVELKNTLGTTVKSDKAILDDIIDGIDTHEELLQEGKNGNKPTFTVFENGERVTFEITEEMYDALKPKGEKLAYRNKFLSGLSTLQRGLLTEYNPVFMLTNAVKDVQDVLINSQHAVKTYANFPKAIAEMASKGKYYTEYMQNGGGQNTYFDNDSNTFTKDKGVIRKVVGMPLDIISGANNVIERLPRLAEYIASRESGRSIEVSMLDAARVTTNFAAGGDITKFLNGNGCTFLNASVQGAVQQVRNIQEAKMNGLKGWVGLAAKFAVAGLPAMLLNHLMWDDDEDYEELADYVKENYYIVAKYGDGKFVRIPKGRTVAVIQSAMEQIKNAATGDDEADLKSFLELAVSNLAPNNPLDNNVVAPLSQAIRNKTWYGDDLVPTRLQDLPSEEQYDESTDSLSRWLGETGIAKKLNISPYQINYVLNQYSGGVGDVVLPMLTPEAESGDNSLVGNITAPLKDKFTTDSVMNNQNVSDFYDTVDELTTNAKSSKATDDDILKSKYMNSVNSELGELYKQKREIQNSNLSDKEKYAKIRDIQKQIDTIAEDSLNTYNNISYDGDYAKIGDKYFQWYTPEGSDPYWRKLTESQTTKYLVTKAAGNSNYATDGTVHYRRDEDGEWTKISDKQLERQNEVTKELGITPEEYWGKTEISFLPMSNGEYEYAYENPEKYAVAKAVGDYDAYKSYSNDLYNIHADKDSNGKSISGSRKEKVTDYINNLDIDYGAKIILLKSEYPSDDTYNYEIIDYLNSREDISYSEMETILTELGFKVHADGTISWD